MKKVTKENIEGEKFGIPDLLVSLLLIVVRSHLLNIFNNFNQF